jgi:PPK2 family polyphosphate:nucleotide phosphotransferase
MKDLSRARALARSYRVTSGKRFRLSAHDPADTGAFEGADEERARALTREGTELLAELQDKLYAQDRWAVLLLLQGMDASGKDTTIREVMSGVNPQGCQVFTFKTPSAEELDHDYLWRCVRALPERGRIGIFNRSYYEEVLVARVHPEVLAAQKLPPRLVTPRIWQERYEDIRAFERYAARQGIVIRKIFLNVSKEEQRSRLLARILVPGKNWKFRPGDVDLRRYWNAYQDAYQDAIRATATPAAPWYVVPADRKWYTRLVVAAVLVDTLAGLDLAYPKLTRDAARAFAEARRLLMRG